MNPAPPVTKTLVILFVMFIFYNNTQNKAIYYRMFPERMNPYFSRSTRTGPNSRFCVRAVCRKVMAGEYELFVSHKNEKTVILWLIDIL